MKSHEARLYYSEILDLWKEKERRQNPQQLKKAEKNTQKTCKKLQGNCKKEQKKRER